MDALQLDTQIVTPASRPGFFGTLAGGEWAQGLAARIAVKLLAKPRRIGSRVFAARHAQVRELLCRDLDFVIAPINDSKIRDVNAGAFVLGMDRSERLERERRALYEALEAVDMDGLRAGVAADIDRVLGAVPPGGEIDIVGGYARPIAARTAQRLFGITGPDEKSFMEVVRSIFAHTFLNLGDDPVIRDRAIKAGRYMSGWYADEIARRRASGELGEDMMGRLLRRGIVDDDGARRTLGGMLVGSIDTTATCVAKIIKVASRDSDLRYAMTRDARDPQRLDGWCNEALRRWSHNPLVMRRAAVDCALAGTKVRKGDTMFALTQAAMFDPSVFYDPKRMDPERDSSIYLHLGWGLHPCSGRPVNRFQIPMLVGALLERGIERTGKISWAGPFPDKIVARLREGAR
ncbi:MAG TPA: cytochrome P450 [Allosphingosinicella sp.]|jgi:cytochrome P450